MRANSILSQGPFRIDVMVRSKFGLTIRRLEFLRFSEWPWLPVVKTNLRTVPVPDPGGSPGSSPSTIFGTLYSQSELARINIYFYV